MALEESEPGVRFRSSERKEGLSSIGRDEHLFRRDAVVLDRVH